LRGDIDFASRPSVGEKAAAPRHVTEKNAPPARPPRILMVSHAAELGGAEQGLLDVSRHFGAAQCDALLFADGPLRQLLEARGISVRVLGADPRILGVRRQGGMLRVLGALPATLSLAAEVARLAKPYGLIYANSQKAALTTMLASAISGKQVLWHLHDILSAEHFGWLQRRAIALLSNHLASAVIVVSAAARTALIRSGGNRARITIIDPAPYFGLPDIERSQLREKHALPGGQLVGLFGRITPWKGQRVLIRALPSLPDTRALIVGSPMFGQDAELAFLHALAARLGVSDRVTFLGYRADAPELMRAVDLVVHCSTAPEPFGRVIVEALFAGTPILAAEGGASTEILGDEPGWRVTPDDPAALATAIDTFFAADPAVQAQRTQTMRARVTHEFSLARMMAAIDALVMRLTC
jgi:glycosyltransferase involved in cell wall biosynthesis